MAADRSLPLLIVASWYPAVDDTSRGRFVADQAAALLATGGALPVVVSFELARLSMGGEARMQQRGVLRASRRTALASSDRIFAPRGWSCPRGVPVARLPIAVAGGAANDAADYADALGEAVERIVRPLPDGANTPVVHAHQGFPDGYAASVVARRHGWPLVITEHYTRVDQRLADPDMADRYREAIDTAARVLVVSAAQGERLRKLVPEVEPKLTVVPNTVAVDEFRIGADDERIRGELLYVGYRKEHKGIAVLLEAFAQARSVRPELVLRLVGRSTSDAEERGWHELARRLGIAEAVRFEPPAGRRGVAEAMARADLLVHAGRWETFGVVAAEALASGLPVVATDSGGITEILDGGDGRLGITVPVDDPAALAAGMLGAMERRGSWDGAALRRAAEERYGAAAVARRLLEVYAEVQDAVPTPPESFDTALTGAVGAARSPTAVLVALARQRAADAMAKLEPSALRRLTVVTDAEAAEEVPLPGGARDTVALPLDREFSAEMDRVRGPRWRRALGRVVGSARADRETRAAQRRRPGLRMEAAAGTIRDLAELHGDVVALDSFDHAAIDFAEVAPAPGGARWLADGWAALENADEDSGVDDAGATPS